MLVRVLVGSDAGSVRFIRPDQARVMLADGRAVLPDEGPLATVAATSSPLVSESVARRVDRVPVHAKRRARR